MHGEAIIEAGRTPVPAQASVARGFYAAVALLTVMPLVLLPLMFAVEDGPLGPPPARVLLIVLTITGSMHVGSSAFFYFDPEFQPLIGRHRLRCLWSLALLPLGLLVLGVAGAAVAGPVVLLAVFAVQNGWLFHHYQRQNFGLISLVNASAGGVPLPRDFRAALDVATIAGVVGALGVPNFFPATLDAIVPRALHASLQPVAVATYLLSFGLLARGWARHASVRRNPALTGALLLGWLFFLPAVAFNVASAAILPLAIAHGSQYLLMMGILSARWEDGWPGALMMAALGVAVGFGLYSLQELPALLAATGIVQVHFLLDAKVWRLREPRQRAIMNRRFDFLLAR